jgi:hypothetical protein
MAKKTPTNSSKNGSPVAAKTVAAAPVVTPVRNSAVPPKATAAPIARKSAPTHDQIALTAYFIWKSGQGGSQDENWFAAERRLRGA